MKIFSQQLNACFVLLLCSLAACTPPGEEAETFPASVEGLRPIYAGQPDLRVQVQAPHTLRNLGKIYHKAPYLFAVEKNAGIHVIDNSDPKLPRPLWFYHIPGCNEMAIRNNLLYTDQWNDLLVIDLRRLDTLSVLSRQRIRTGQDDLNLPAGYNGYIECPDPKKGPVIGWEPAVLEKPRCKTAR